MTTLPLRLALRPGPVDLVGAGEHGDLCPGVAQRIRQGPEASAYRAEIFRPSSAPVYDERCPMGEGVVQGACRRVVLLGKPVYAGGAKPVSECVDGLDMPVCDVPAAPRLGDVEVFQIAGRVRGPGSGMEDQMREPGQLILLFGDESVRRRRRVAQRRPGALGHLRCQHRPVEVELTVPQRFPAFPPSSTRIGLTATSLVVWHPPLLAQ